MKTKTKENYIVGIGACNVDIYGKSQIKIKTHFDHPAKITSNVGGVTHNIVTNFAKFGNSAKLITAYGDDGFGNVIVADCKKNNIDISDSLCTKGKSSNVFMQVQDEKNDMYLALCDMSSLANITPEYVRKKAKTILNAKLLVLDPSLPLKTIEELIKMCKGKVPIYLDPISDVYATKAKKYVKDLTCVKPNKTELECLSGIKIKTDEDIYKACRSLLHKGLEKIYVSLGKDGLLYMDKNTSIRKKLKPEKKMVNASGAGDALMAAIVHGAVNNIDVEKTVYLGLAAGIAAIRCIDTINPNMSISLLKKILKENNIKL